MKFNSSKVLRLPLAIISAFLLFTACFDDFDDNIVPTSVDLEIKDFVWEAMNTWYLYKDEIPELADDAFSSDEEYRSYLESFDSPEALFESLIFRRESVDRFSVIYDDFIEAEQSSQGISTRTGIRINLIPDPQGSGNYHGLILEVAKDSPADDAGLTRGTFFSTIGGTEITLENYRDLIGVTTFTLGISEYSDNDTPGLEDDSVNLTGDEITLTRVVYIDDAINLSEVLTVDGKKVGYLVYNRFNDNFEAELNSVFGDFKDANVDELIIDLRYNPGGRIVTAARLASMITGQFNGEVFSKFIYNADRQEFNKDFLFTDQIGGGQSINSLNLSKVYVLTTSGSASASELLINSLNAYINVVHIGESTTGKTQGSFLMYDSPDLSATNRNPRHTYAIQPLVANSIDKNSMAVPATGLIPDIQVMEIPNDYQIFDFGDFNERLLAAAIADITGSSRLRNLSDGVELQPILDADNIQGGLIIENEGKVMRKKLFKIK